MPAILDQRPFLATQNFRRSIDFYTRLGWTSVYQDADLALMELGASHLFLQNAFVETWAHNTMLHLIVDDAQAWYETALRVKTEGGFDEVKVSPPRREAYGALATHVIDPAGILLFFAQMD
ncbi:VOC family protein [Asticcacaulis sp. 201]|uniref:VOC family protein n=1 Tax=Asticcacaulis sp. 201 TaxID=3028787 RepID=UPI002916EEEC|nr:VOC family protein [Asticcacaulis sp. 201]MDV6329895.1 bleomycin resistance protein [Asticcacaulis sp. 201]